MLLKSPMHQETKKKLNFFFFFTNSQSFIRLFVIIDALETDTRSHFQLQALLGGFNGLEAAPR